MARPGVQPAQMGTTTMKGTPRSLWLSAANRVTGWWMGHAANAIHQAQRAAMKQALKPPKAPRARKPRQPR
jgi:hypothetical protein